MIAPVRKPWIFGYGRRSTDQQTLSLDQQQSVIEMSIEAHRKLGKFNEDGAVYREFVGDDSSRKYTFLQRKQGAMLALVLQPGDYLYVSNYDRLFGTVRDVCEGLEFFQTRGIKLIILDCNIDTSTILGEAMMQILGVIKNLERKEIGRRTREGLQHRRRKGLPAGQPPIGWAIQRKHLSGGKVRKRFIPDEETRRIANYIVDMRDKSGWSFEKITLAMQTRVYNGDDKWKNPRSRNRKGHNGMFSVHTTRRFYYAATNGYPVNDLVHAPGVPDLPDAPLIAVGGNNPLS